MAARPPKSPGPESASRRAARVRWQTGLAISALGSLLMFGGFLGLVTGRVTSGGTAVAVLGAMVAGVIVLGIGLTRLEAAFRRIELPIDEGEARRLRSRAFRSEVLWAAGLAVYIAGAALQSAGLPLVVLGLGMIFVSCGLYAATVLDERRLRKQASRGSRGESRAA